MKTGKAPVILIKKAVTVCKSKTAVLTARLPVFTSLRRRMAMVGLISHKIHAVMVAEREKTPRYGGEMVGDHSDHQLALFDQEEEGDGGCSPDWARHPIFNNDGNCGYIEEYEEDDHEPSVMDVIGSNREVEGLELEFNMGHEIDQAAEIFIRRFREQMNESNISDLMFGMST